MGENLKSVHYERLKAKIHDIKKVEVDMSKHRHTKKN